jgi:hypothetical protein
MKIGNQNSEQKAAATDAKGCAASDILGIVRRFAELFLPTSPNIFSISERTSALPGAGLRVLDSRNLRTTRAARLQAPPQGLAMAWMNHPELYTLAAIVGLTGGKGQLMRRLVFLMSVLAIPQTASAQQPAPADMKVISDCSEKRGYQRQARHQLHRACGRPLRAARPTPIPRKRRACAQRELVVWNAISEAAAKRVRTGRVQGISKALLESDKAWAQQRDALCPVFDKVEPGSLPGDATYCRMQTTANRALLLRKLGDSERALVTHRSAGYAFPGYAATADFQGKAGLISVHHTIRIADKIAAGPLARPRSGESKNGCQHRREHCKGRCIRSARPARRTDKACRPAEPKVPPATALPRRAMSSGACRAMPTASCCQPPAPARRDTTKSSDRFRCMIEEMGGGLWRNDWVEPSKIAAGETEMVFQHPFDGPACARALASSPASKSKTIFRLDMGANRRSESAIFSPSSTMNRQLPFGGGVGHRLFLADSAGRPSSGESRPWCSRG